MSHSCSNVFEESNSCCNGNIRSLPEIISGQNSPNWTPETIFWIFGKLLMNFDEVSLTSDFKTFTGKGEALHSTADLGFEQLSEADIKGGDTVESSAKIFMSILNGEGTDAQRNVVLCNAAIAIQTIDQKKSFGDCFYEAEAALMNKQALRSFKTLLSA